MVEITIAGFQKPYQERVCLLRIDLEPPSIQSQEHVGGEEGNTFVPVDERVVHQQRLKKGSGHLREIVVVAGTRAEKGTFEQTGITYACRFARPSL